MDILQEKRKNNLLEYYMGMGMSKDEAEFTFTVGEIVEGAKRHLNNNPFNVETPDD